MVVTDERVNAYDGGAKSDFEFGMEAPELLSAKAIYHPRDKENANPLVSVTLDDGEAQPVRVRKVIAATGAVMYVLMIGRVHVVRVTPKGIVDLRRELMEAV